MDKMAMDIHVKVFVWAYVFISPGQIPRSGIIGSYGKYIFNFIRNWHTFSQ